MSRQVGLKDFTIAMLTSDTATIGAVAGAAVYGTPQKLERSIKAVLKPKSTATKLYSDDTVEEVVNLLDSIDVTIELNQLSVESRALLQGSKVVKGVLVENKDDIAPTMAIGFRSKKTNKKFRYVWLYKGSFEITEDTFETEEDKTKAQTATLVGTFYPRESDGAFRLIADEDSETIEPAFITSFFTAVAEQPSGAAVGILTVTSIAGTTSGTTKLTVAPTVTVGNSYVYKSAATVVIPSLNDICSVAVGYTTWAGTTDITATTGDEIEIIEVDSTFRAIKAGSATVVAMA